jgi:hypothetical protein
MTAKYFEKYSTKKYFIFLAGKCDTDVAARGPGRPKPMARAVENGLLTIPEDGLL